MERATKREQIKNTLTKIGVIDPSDEIHSNRSINVFLDQVSSSLSIDDLELMIEIFHPESLDYLWGNNLYVPESEVKDLKKIIAHYSRDSHQRDQLASAIREATKRISDEVFDSLDFRLFFGGYLDLLGMSASAEDFDPSQILEYVVRDDFQILHGEWGENQSRAKIIRKLGLYMQNSPKRLTQTQIFDLASKLTGTDEGEEVLYLFDCPEILAIIVESVSLDDSWSTRLRLFKSLIEACGINLVAASTVDHFLLKSFQEFPNSEAKKQKELTQIRRSYSKAELNSLRAKMRTEKINYDEWYEERLQHAAIVEHPYFPPNSLGLTQLNGIEVEYPHTGATWHNHLAEVALEMIGLHHGTGGDICREFSPGPFNHPETAWTALSIYLDSDLIDFHQYEGIGVHFNIDLIKDEGLAKLIMSFIAAGYGYDPRTSSIINSAYDYTFSFYNKTGKKDNYFESKHFTVSTPRELYACTVYATKLAWALNAYQATTRKRSSNQYLVSKQNALSQLWKEYRASLSEIGARNGVNFGKKSNTLFWGEIITINHQLRRLFPSMYDRYQSKDELAANNLVTDLRSLISKTCVDIDQLYDQIVNDSLILLNEIATSKDKDRARLINKYFKKFVHNSLPSTPIARPLIIRELCQLFGIAYRD